MEKRGAKKYSFEAVPMEQIKIELQVFVVFFLKIFSVKNFKTCDKIILFGMLLLFLMSPVLGEFAQGINSDMIVSNSTAAINPKPSSSKSDIFYNVSSNSANHHNHNNNSNICLQEHRIKEREVKEESLGLKKRKDGNDEKGKNLKSLGNEKEDFGFGSSKETHEAMSKRSTCDKDKIRIKSLEAIKNSILSKLGMSEPPNVTDGPKPKVSENFIMMLLRKRHQASNGLNWMVQEDDWEEMQGDEPYDSRSSDKVSGKNGDFGRSQGNASDNEYIDSSELQEGEISMQEEDDYHVRTQRIVAFSQPHPRIRHLPHIQYFEFSDRVRSSKVKRALLWMYIKGRESTSVVGNKITISIYKILDAGKLGSNGSRESPVITSVRVDSTQSIPDGSGAWITMEYIQIKNLVAEWFRYPQQNLGIVIIAEDANRTNLAVTTLSGNDTAFAPFLEVYVTDNPKHRAKRMIGLNCKSTSKETRCCRHPLTVDFVEFGWDWIIAPKKYEAFYCAGDCPLAFLPQHPHTHVSQLALGPDNGPCCAPRKLSELDVLYFDQNMNIIFGKIPAMKVDRCGCS